MKRRSPLVVATGNPLLDRKIEMPTELYTLVTGTILEYLPYRMKEFISEIFKQRMKQIMEDPKEFGELMLQSVNDVRSMQNCEW